MEGDWLSVDPRFQATPTHPLVEIRFKDDGEIETKEIKSPQTSEKKDKEVETGVRELKPEDIRDVYWSS